MRLEVLAFVGGIIVFFALLGSFYFLFDARGKTDMTGIGSVQPAEEQLKKGTSDQKLKTFPTLQSLPTAASDTGSVLPPMTINPNKQYSAVLETSEGDITISLNVKLTPQTANNFISLARRDFYDKTIFHRVIRDFMIQGGDPKGDGTGGPGYTVPAEINKELKHVRGAISMARLPDSVNPQKRSSGSQFFIVHKDTPQLDGEYTVFGQVSEGMDVVDRIAAVAVKPGASGEPSSPVTPVTIKNIKIIEE